MRQCLLIQKGKIKGSAFPSSLCLFHIPETEVLSVFGGLVEKGLGDRKSLL